MSSKFLFVFLLFTFFFLVWLRRRDTKYLKKRTREALSTPLRKEIEEEREINAEKRKRFEEAMKEADAQMTVEKEKSS